MNEEKRKTLNNKISAWFKDTNRTNIEFSFTPYESGYELEQKQKAFDKIIEDAVQEALHPKRNITSGRNNVATGYEATSNVILDDRDLDVYTAAMERTRFDKYNKLAEVANKVYGTNTKSKKEACMNSRKYTHNKVTLILKEITESTISFWSNEDQNSLEVSNENTIETGWHSTRHNEREFYISCCMIRDQVRNVTKYNEEYYNLMYDKKNKESLISQLTIELKHTWFKKKKLQYLEDRKKELKSIEFDIAAYENPDYLEALKEVEDFIKST